MNGIKININDEVKVKLTDYGVACLYKKRNKYIRQKPFHIELDKQGYYRTQLWVLMQEFGEYISMGLKVPFETEIILVKKEGEVK